MTEIIRERESVYFKSIKLENVRSFGPKQQLSFVEPNGNICFWNVIIGNNGVGKTTVLRSLAAGVIVGEDQPLIETDYFSRDTSKRTSITYEFSTFDKNLKSSNKSEFLKLDFEDKSSFSKPSTFQIDLSSGEINWFLVVFGYGASRRIAPSSLTLDKDGDGIATLFDENAPLLNAEEWLVEADYRVAKSGNSKYASRKKKVVEILKKLFRGEVHDFKIDLEGKRPKVKCLTDYGWVNLHDLSLGYKTLIAWMTDFAIRMFEQYPDRSDPLAEPAVVLVDEIDLHLHPQFQRELQSFLTETFPKTQFIVTAHSPLILQSAPDANIILLKKEGDHVVVEQNLHQIKNWRIDQILNSDLYGFVGARPPQTEDKIARRRSLLKKEKLNQSEASELENLEEELIDLPVGETPEAIKAMEIIQKATKHYEKQNGKD
ncbi:MAG: AAA family ATPase [Saprospiraceae bacterium]|nr:AAA family ATPase [Saprospiraceae bacterium]